jgi:broad specificity phosphatase PhoE
MENHVWSRKMKLYFTRHGKTEWNQQMRFQGMFGDSPLLPESYKEIKLLGQHLKEVPFAKIYSSTSLRARETAETLNQELVTPAEIIYTDKLKELGLGQLEGQLIKEMRAMHGHQLDHMRYRLDQYDPTVFEGESIEAAIERISQVVKAAVAANQGPLLFVGHGASMTAAIQALSGKPLAQLRAMGGLKNNSLSMLETQEPENHFPYQLKIWNDTSFLTDKNTSK